LGGEGGGGITSKVKGSKGKMHKCFKDRNALNSNRRSLATVIEKWRANGRRPLKTCNLFLMYLSC